MCGLPILDILHVILRVLVILCGSGNFKMGGQARKQNVAEP